MQVSNRSVDMSDSVSFGKSVKILLLVAIVGVVAHTGLVLGCNRAVSWSPDSFYYLRCAENLKAVFGGREWVGGWFGTWPIGYPLALAAVTGVMGLEAFVASKVLGVLATMGLLGLFAVYARRAFPLLALSILNLAYLKIFRGTLSEQLFIPLLAWLGFEVARLISVSDRFGWRRVVALSGLFVGLFLVRYMGVFAPLWVVCGLCAAGGRRGVGRGVWLMLGVASLVAWGFEAVYLGINWSVTGHMTGVVRDVQPEALGRVAVEIAGAGVRDMQAYGLAAFWFGVLGVLGCVGRGDGLPKGDDVTASGGRVLVGMGVGYGLTLAVVRLVGGCSQLGFRLTYPGTMLVVSGLILWSSRYWAFRRLSLWRGMLLVVIVLGIGTSLLEWELVVRRALGVSTYEIGAPYLEVKDRLLKKYEAVKSGETIHLRGLEDEDLPIIYLRPDVKFEFPKGAKKY